MAPVITLAQLNGASREEFARLLDGTYEHSPWIAARAWEKRPFSSLAALKQALVRMPSRRRLPEFLGGACDKALEALARMPARSRVQNV